MALSAVRIPWDHCSVYDALIMCDCNEIEEEGFWGRVNEAKSKDLVIATITAAQEQVQFSHAHHNSERAIILLGSSAGQSSRLGAEIHQKRRNSQLLLVKRSLARLVEESSAEAKRHVDEYFGGDSWGEFLTYAKQEAVHRLLYASGSSDETRKALDQLNSTLEELGGLSSLEAVTKYLNHHVEELVKGKMGKPNPDGICILILIITSIFAVLVIIAVIICAFSFGLACDGILQQMINQACPM